MPPEHELRHRRYAAHPFFLQGYTLCANGENTFYTKNTEYQKSLHRGYVGFESDSQNFLYTLHYVLRELKWPLKYFKHVITPLPFAEAERRGDRKVLSLIRESLAHLEINGPNTIIAVLPDGSMMTCCDSKSCALWLWAATGRPWRFLRVWRLQCGAARSGCLAGHLSQRAGSCAHQ